MQRTFLTLLGWALLAFAPLALSQESRAQPCPEVPPGTVGCQLVAWSHLQEPVPLPEAETKAAPPPGQQPGELPSSQIQSQSTQRSTVSVSPIQPGSDARPPSSKTTF